LLRTFCGRCGRNATCKETRNGYICYRCIKDTDRIKCQLCLQYKRYEEFPILRTIDGKTVRKSVCKSCYDLVHMMEIRERLQGLEISNKTKEIRERLQSPINYAKDKFEATVPLLEALKLCARFEYDPKILTNEETKILTNIREGRWCIK